MATGESDIQYKTYLKPVPERKKSSQKAGTILKYYSGSNTGTTIECARQSFDRSASDDRGHKIRDK